MPYETLLPSFLLESYEVHERRHAAAILATDFPGEWADLLRALTTFRLYRREIEAPGGGRSAISARMDRLFYQRDWREKKFDTEFRVNGELVDAKGHKVDNYKNAIACDVEWNNKTEFFDRDLNNFARLHALGAIAVGIIITRSSRLEDDVIGPLGVDPWEHRPYIEKYGASTTHMDKLVPKVNGGAAGGCPVLLLGITRSLYVDDVTHPELYSPHPEKKQRWRIENPELARDAKRQRKERVAERRASEANDE